MAEVFGTIAAGGHDIRAMTKPTKRKRRKTASRGGPEPVDIHVGRRVRERPTKLGMSHEALGIAVGLTFQQIQKYERGANRIGASRIYEFSRILDVPIGFFFDGLSATASRTTTSEDSDLLDRSETLRLVRAYYTIPDPRVRKKVFELVKGVAKSGQD